MYLSLFLFVLQKSEFSVITKQASGLLDQSGLAASNNVATLLRNREVCRFFWLSYQKVRQFFREGYLSTVIFYTVLDVN